MKKEYPTPDVRLARLRIQKHVGVTGERAFAFRDVAVQPRVLMRLADVGLLNYLEKESREFGTPVYRLPEGAIRAQEQKFKKELTQIRTWSRATRRYTFNPADVQIHYRVLENMVNNGLLGRTGRQYTVFWRSLSKQWVLR